MDIRQAILDADDLPTEPIDVPEWDMTVYVRSMTGYERDLYEGGLISKTGLPMSERMLNLRSTLVVLCTVDENGERIFTDDDKQLVGQKSAKALERIVEAAQRMNELSDTDIEEAAGN